MRRTFAVILLGAAIAGGQTKLLPVESGAGIQVRKVKAEPATHKGRKALRVTDAVSSSIEANEDRLAIIAGSELRNGTVELELSGEPGPGAGEGARGFAGVAFRVAPDASKFECIYLRPTNGRAEDQVRRNHSVQYISFPGFPWQKLRKEFPEKYETYVDLVPGEWTKVRIDVEGTKARLFVHGTPQPVLLVNDLKHGDATGSVALWIGPGTVAHFSSVRVTPSKP